MRIDVATKKLPTLPDAAMRISRGQYVFASVVVYRRYFVAANAVPERRCR